MNVKNQLLYLILASFIIHACGNRQEVAEPESSFIEISNHQFTTVQMQLGKIEQHPFESTIKCNGTIEPLPGGLAIVSAPVNGIIKSILVSNGQPVAKYQVLAEITGNELIDIQKDYAEASSSHKRLQSEYERVKSLYNDKVTSEKEFIQIETEFKMALARYGALKLKVEGIGLSPARIENGEFYAAYALKSPISGYASNISTQMGSYIDARAELMEIVNPGSFQVKLSLFANDISLIRKGQTVRFKMRNADPPHTAEINSIGIAIDDATKLIDCYAFITDKSISNPLANEFVECEIVTGTDTVNALPSDAIIKTESGSYILVLNKQEKDKYLFEKKMVTIGRQKDGFTELLNDRIEGSVLTKGAYNITL